MPIFPKIFFSVFFLLSLGLSIYGIYYMLLAYMAKHWSSTQGTVVQSFVDSRLDPHDENHLVSYNAHIEYTYRINEKEYRSNRIHFGQRSSSDPTSSEKFVSRYPYWSTVSVIYKPSDPSQAILERHISTVVYFPLLFGLIGMCLSGLLIFAL